MSIHNGDFKVFFVWFICVKVDFFSLLYYTFTFIKGMQIGFDIIWANEMHGYAKEENSFLIYVQIYAQEFIK